jgi:hypothetical protein
MGSGFVYGSQISTSCSVGSRPAMLTGSSRIEPFSRLRLPDSHALSSRAASDIAGQGDLRSAANLHERHRRSRMQMVRHGITLSNYNFINCDFCISSSSMLGQISRGRRHVLSHMTLPLKKTANASSSRQRRGYGQNMDHRPDREHPDFLVPKAHSDRAWGVRNFTGSRAGQLRHEGQNPTVSGPWTPCGANMRRSRTSR